MGECILHLMIHCSGEMEGDVGREARRIRLARDMTLLGLVMDLRGGWEDGHRIHLVALEETTSSKPYKFWLGEGLRDVVDDT